MITVAIQVDLSGLRRFLSESQFSTEKKTLLLLLARMYRSDMRERFMRLSRSGGGGEWPPLAESTIMARRHGKKGRYKRGRAAYKKAVASGGGQVSILWDTGTLLAALNPDFGKAGQFQQLGADGASVEVGFGSGEHPSGHGRTIAEIASYHQTGAGRLPQRKILVPPSAACKARMTAAVKTWLKRLTSKYSKGGVDGY